MLNTCTHHTCKCFALMLTTAQDEFEFAFKKVMVMLCREQRIEMFVKVDLDCRRVTRARTRAHARAHTQRSRVSCSGTIEFDEFLSFFVEPVDMCAFLFPAHTLY